MRGAYFYDDGDRDKSQWSICGAIGNEDLLVGGNDLHIEKSSEIEGENNEVASGIHNTWSSNIIHEALEYPCANELELLGGGSAIERLEIC